MGGFPTIATADVNQKKTKQQLYAARLRPTRQREASKRALNGRRFLIIKNTDKQILRGQTQAHAPTEGRRDGPLMGSVPQTANVPYPTYNSAKAHARQSVSFDPGARRSQNRPSWHLCGCGGNLMVQQTQTSKATKLWANGSPRAWRRPVRRKMQTNSAELGGSVPSAPSRARGSGRHRLWHHTRPPNSVV